MTKSQNQATKSKIKDRIIQTVENEKPETIKQLIELIQKRHAVSYEQATNMVIELENEGSLHFQKKGIAKHSSTKNYIFSKQTLWYWSMVALVAATTIAVFSISESDVPLVYLRFALGTIFLLFLPGFSLIKVLFPAEVPIKTSSDNLDKIEQVGLSLGLSLVLVPIIGLALNYTPWGIRLLPLISILLLLTVIFATIAIFIEYHKKMDTAHANH